MPVRAGRHSFDETKHARDDDGQFTSKGGGGGGRHSAPDAPSGDSAAPAKGADKLKLHDRVAFEPGETLVASGRTTSDIDTNLALLDTGTGPKLLVGFDFDRPWKGATDDSGEETGKGNPNDGLTTKLDQQGISAFAAALDDVAAKIRAADDELSDLGDEEDILNGLPSHGELVADVRADIENMTRSATRSPELRDRLEPSIAEQRAHLAEIEALTPEQFEERNAARLREVETRSLELMNGITLSEGSIPGEWGDLVWEAESADSSGGSVTIGVRPHGAPAGWDLYQDLSSNGNGGSNRFDADDLDALTKQLRRIAKAGGVALPAVVQAAGRRPVGRTVALGRVLAAKSSGPKLARRDGVELIHAGAWNISSGTWDASAADLAHAVAALDCPAIRPPVLKLGHVDPRFDGQPAVGRVENLRLTDQGRTLVGDYVGHPMWLDQVMASAYPDRSVEGAYGFKCQIGHTHPFVLSAVALLGVTAPGVGTLGRLEDIAAMYGVEIAASGEPNGTPVSAVVEAAKGEPGKGADHDQLKTYWTKGDGLKRWINSAHQWTTLYGLLKKHLPNEMAKRVASEWFHDVLGYWPGSRQNRKTAASTPPDDGSTMPSPKPVEVAGINADDLRAAFYASAEQDLWITEIHPDRLIVTSGKDRRFRRVPFRVEAGQPVFDAPVLVRPDYVDADVAASAVLVYASAAESRPEPPAEPPAEPGGKPDEPLFQPPVDPADDTAAPEPPHEPPAEPETTPTEEEEMALSPAAIGALGLKFGADDEAISAAIVALAKKVPSGDDRAKVAASAEQQQEAEKKIAAAAAENAALSEKVGLLTEQVQELSQHVASVNAEKATTVKASVIGDALKTGRISPAQREQWETRYDAAPEVVKDVLASIAPGTAVPVMASGYTGGDEPQVTGLDAEYERLFTATGTGV